MFPIASSLLALASSLVGPLASAAPQTPGLARTSLDSLQATAGSYAAFAPQNESAASAGGTPKPGSSIWIGGGLEYRAELRGELLRFVPALGSAVAVPALFDLQLARVQRGTSVLWQRTAAAALTSEPVVLPSRGSWTPMPAFDQRVDLARDGIELSYLFRSRPAGSGDLRVELDLAFPLQRSAASADGGIDFYVSASAGVHVGTVSGIDAVGTRVAGSLSFDGARLALTLPERFVEAAQYPILLDPLITPLSDLGGGGEDQALPDVAFVDGAPPRYLVAWERRMSLNQVDVIGQLLESDGQSSAPNSFVQIRVGDGSNPQVAQRPSVGGSDKTDVFVVAWQESDSPFGPFSVKARTVRGSDGDKSAEVLSLGTQGENPDVASDPSGDPLLARVYVCFRGATGVELRIVTALNDLVPTVLTSLTAADTGGAVGAPSISAFGGPGAETFLCVFERVVGGLQDLYGFTVQSQSAKPVANLTNTQNGTLETRPVCDGDAATFLLAYERAAGAGGSSDIQARVVTVGAGGSISAAAAVDVAAATLQETEPAIVRVNNEHWITWSEQQSADPLKQRVLVTSLDPRDALACEVPKPLADASAFHGRSRLAAPRDTGQAQFSTGLATWTRKSFTEPTGGKVDSALLQDAGFVTNLGGGCGNGGQASLVCAPATGNTQFGHRLTGASGTQVCALLFGTVDANLGCTDSCVLHVNPFASTSWFVIFQTSSTGSAQADTAVPASALGLQIREQWAVLTTSGAACSLIGAALSNALSYTIVAP
jgi:hypothetical protein